MYHSLTTQYWFDDGTHNLLRCRSVSDLVITGTIDVHAPPIKLLADWEREMNQQLKLEPGEVEILPLARARMRWPDYSACVQAMNQWTRTLGLADVLASS